MRLQLAGFALLFSIGCDPNQTVSPPRTAPAPPPIQTPEDKAVGRMEQVLADQKSNILGMGRRILGPIWRIRTSDRLQDLAQARSIQAEWFVSLRQAHDFEEGVIWMERELRYSAVTYDHEADMYRRRSEDFKDDLTKAVDLYWSKYYERLRDRVPEHLQRINELKSVQPVVVGRLREFGMLLDDYIRFLEHMPTDNNPSEEVANQVAAMKSYMQKFTEFEKALYLYGEGVNGPPQQ